MKIYTESKTVLADVQTPVSIYLKIRDLFPESALLESSDFHGNENSFSFIGLNPLARFEVRDGWVETGLAAAPETKTKIDAGISVADELNRFLRSFEVAGDNTTADFNGFFGYTAYDAVRYFEDVDPGNVPGNAGDIPDMIYIFYRYLLVVNHFKNEMTIIENRTEGEISRIDEVLALLENRNYASYNFAARGKET
ncbi:MAG: anthranilate synthase component I family protein, partial [Candidatus Symbiothrix sp.]|nr:anthranilate synthase component I family protein [Candidatus Symbiothrix sp.]